jgi:hypothetical protein
LIAAPKLANWLWDGGRLARIKQRVHSTHSKTRIRDGVAFHEKGRGARDPSSKLV